MADTKVSGLTRLTAPIRGDLLYSVDDPSGTPLSTYANVEDVIAGPSLLVAASNATTAEIRNADYICDGTADQVQIQAAIDGLPASGGKVCLSSGTFTIARAGVAANPAQGYCILIDQNDGPVVLEGSGWSTIVKLADNQDANSCSILIRGDNGDMRTSATAVRNMKIDGNLTGQVAAWTDFSTVEVAYAYDLLFDGLWIIDPCLIALRPLFRASERATTQNCMIDSSNGKTGLRNEGAIGSIFNNTFIANNTTAVASCDLATNADIDIPSEYISVQNNTFIGGLIQFHMGGARRCVLFGNKFLDATNANAVSVTIEHYGALHDYGGFESVVVGNTFHNVGTAIKLTSGANADLFCYRNLIANNSIVEGPGVNLSFGIRETSADAFTNYNVIVDNIIQNASTPIVRIGANTVVRGNMGYVTENDGAAAAVADGGTIAHGCATTPTNANVSGSVAGEIVTVTSLDATNITVAIKDNDGTPGTNQTVYWRAWV